MSVLFDSGEYFPVKISHCKDTEFDDYKDDLIEWILDYKERDDSEVKISNIGGWQSNGNFYLQEESFKPFMEKIWKVICELIHSFADGLQMSEIIEKGNQLKLLNIWINVNPPGSFNMVHQHPGTLLSGAFWIKAPEDSGNLTFHDPNEMNNYCLGNNAVTFPPQEGVCCLFPAYVPHDVGVNKSEDTRISISFNLDFD